MSTHCRYVTDLKVITALQMEPENECTIHTREMPDFREISSFCVKTACHYKAQWWTAYTELYHLLSYVMWHFTVRDRFKCFHVWTFLWIPPSRFSVHFQQHLFCSKPHHLFLLINHSHGSLQQPINCSQNPNQQSTSIHPISATELHRVPEQRHSQWTLFKTDILSASGGLNHYKIQKFIALPWARLIHSLQSLGFYLASIML